MLGLVSENFRPLKVGEIGFDVRIVVEVEQLLSVLIKDFNLLD